MAAKIHIGERGGAYYVKNGRKVYVKLARKSKRHSRKSRRSRRSRSRSRQQKRIVYIVREHKKRSRRHSRSAAQKGYSHKKKAAAKMCRQYGNSYDCAANPGCHWGRSGCRSGGSDNKLHYGPARPPISYLAQQTESANNYSI